MPDGPAGSTGARPGIQAPGPRAPRIAARGVQADVHGCTRRAGKVTDPSSPRCRVPRTVRGRCSIVSLHTFTWPQSGDHLAPGRVIAADQTSEKPSRAPLSSTTPSACDSRNACDGDGQQVQRADYPAGIRRGSAERRIRADVHGGQPILHSDPHWRDLLLFYEYFKATTESASARVTRPAGPVPWGCCRCSSAGSAPRDCVLVAAAPSRARRRSGGRG